MIRHKPSTPRTGPADFHEGSQAAERFRKALTRLASAPASALPRQPEPRAKTNQKKGGK